MTQGELLSAFAPIDTFIQICKERFVKMDEYLTTNDINMIMPFVTKAHEAAEKLSCFALEHSNSEDENKRNLSKLIHNKLILIQNSLLYETLLGRERSSIAWLNNSIRSVNSLIDNTIELLDEMGIDKDNTKNLAKSERNNNLEARNKELEEENRLLREKNEQLADIKNLFDTPLDGFEADSKVGLTLIMKLMKNDGADFEKSNNKTIAAKALKMMTGRSESACKQIFSVPLSPTYSGHKKKITELNGYLETLGMKTRL